MPRPALSCTVKFNAKVVTCPGTLHLSDRNLVFLTVSFFGQTKRTNSTFASFPFEFNQKLYFERVFTNARNVDQALEILEDENVVIDIRQYSDRYEGGKVLVKHEQSAREFLFPGPSFIPKNEMKREILLKRTPHFTASRGINPQLEFTTRTTIKETEISSGYHDFIESVKSNPTKTRSKTKTSPRRNSRKIIELSSSETEEEVIITTPRRTSKREHNTVTHCVCECPNKKENRRRVNVRSRSISPKRQLENGFSKPPFKAGKAPKYLISKRDFPSRSPKRSPKRMEKCKSVREEQQGPCSHCLIPHPDCAVCTAYEKAYGTDFLEYRFLCNKTRPRPSTAPPIPTIISHDNTPFSIPRARARIPVESPIDDSDVEQYSRVLQSAPVGRSKTRSRIFPKRSYATVSPDGIRGSPSTEIHQRVKDLLRKNDSVLQYDPSDSNSDNDSFTSLDNLRLSLDEAPIRTSSTTDLPSRSIVVPAGDDSYWSKRASDYTGRSHRKVFNDSLGSIYRELYEQALESD